MILPRHYKEDERLFSTGNEELDNLLQEVYYSGIEDGYDYAQKEFGWQGQVSKVAGSGVGSFLKGYSKTMGSEIRVLMARMKKATNPIEKARLKDQINRLKAEFDAMRNEQMRLKGSSIRWSGTIA